MRFDAVLFDIDGTLVDSNYLHVEAWSRAFFELRVDVDGWRIHRLIGMDSDKLLVELLGARADAVGPTAKALHSSFYSKMQSRLRPFDQGRELVAELARRGMKVVLATSAPEDELAKLRSVLEIEASITLVTSAEDVATAKPAPDIVSVALKRSRTVKTKAVMIGDSAWDVIAAKDAGVAAIGLLSGGTSGADLLEAGATEVYADVADLLHRLDDSLLA